MPQLNNQLQAPRVLLMGDSATGKTGALAQLANAGYRILLHDFDMNARVINSYLKPDAAPVYVHSYDVARMTNTGILDLGMAVQKAAVKQMNEFFKQLKHWKTPEEDLGPWSKLTSRDVIVLDSLTFLGDLLMLAAHEHPEANKHAPTIYRIAGDFLKRILSDLCSNENQASVLCLAHIQSTGTKDTDGNIIEATRKEIPVGIGQQASKRIASYFSDIWQLSVDRSGQRTLATTATNKIALRTSNPAKIKATEPFDLASMFNRLLET